LIPLLNKFAIFSVLRSFCPQVNFLLKVQQSKLSILILQNIQRFRHCEKVRRPEELMVKKKFVSIIFIE